MTRSTGSGSDHILLSICIATYRRGPYIGETLDSILQQMPPGVELLVVDGASPDDTPQVMHRYLQKHPEIVYRREERNSGVDADYDKAVGYARGRYCWLMSDDDLLMRDALAQVLVALRDGVDLLVINAEVRNKTFSAVLQPRLLPVTSDLSYGPRENERFFVLAANYLTFIGAVIIRRELWLARSREPYYGTNFIHVGVIFQSPLPGSIRVLADPLVMIRYGNALWSQRSFEIWMYKWPGLIWSFGHLSEAARRRITRPNPARSPQRLLWFRAIGALGQPEYERLLNDNPDAAARHLIGAVMWLPASLLNAALAIYCLFSAHPFARLKLFELAKASCSTSVSRVLARLRGASDV